MQIANEYVHLHLDTAQRAEIADLVRHAPDTTLGKWLKQHLVENGGNGQIPCHQDDTLVGLVAVMTATINDLRERVESLEESLEQALEEALKAAR